MAEVTQEKTQKKEPLTKKAKAKKALNIVANVLVYVFFALCVLVLIFSIFSKRDADGAVKMFGYEMRNVVSPSMEKDENFDYTGLKIKDLPVKTLVFVKLKPENEAKAAEWYASLKVGDVLTFRYRISRGQITITHRIISIEEEREGGYVIVLQGDNGASEDNDTRGTQTIHTKPQNAEESANYIIGKVTGQSYFLGILVWGVKQPVGIALIIIIPCVIIILLQVVKIVGAAGEGKRKKIEEERKAKEREVEELKRKIAELENGETGSDDPQ